MISNYPFYELGLGGVRLKVRGQDVTKAYQILDKHRVGSMLLVPYWYGVIFGVVPLAMAVIYWLFMLFFGKR